jgi:hypothetical protein
MKPHHTPDSPLCPDFYVNDESLPTSQRLAIEHFLDEDTATFNYLVLDRSTR